MKGRFQNIILIAWTGIFSIPALHAQGPADAILYSQDEVHGTARYSGMGGAFGALGGDFSGLTINPGGIGVYRSSEFTITPALYTGSSIGNYEGSRVPDHVGNINFGNLGFVGVKNFGHGKWKSAQFAIGVNRTANYHQRSGISGTEVPTSLLDDYAFRLNSSNIPWQDLDGSAYYPFDIALAWQTFLIDTLPGGQQYGNAIGLLPLDQEYSIREEGSKRETYIGGGANYDHRLYFGGGISFLRTNYAYTSRYSEYIRDDDTTTNLREFSRHEYYDAEGLGISLKGGAIYRATDWLRIGLAAQTPTWIAISDEYSSEMNAIYGDTLNLQSDLPTGTYEFSVRTPYRVTGSLGFILGKTAIVSLDADFIDYRTMRMRAITDNYDFNAENTAIKNSFVATTNIRSGIEWRFAPTWYARGGFAYYGNPYAEIIDDNGATQTYSLGMGYRDDTYIFDVSYQLGTWGSRTYLYDVASPANTSYTNHQVAVTLGLRF